MMGVGRRQQSEILFDVVLLDDDITLDGSSTQVDVYTSALTGLRIASFVKLCAVATGTDLTTPITSITPYYLRHIGADVGWNPPSAVWNETTDINACVERDMGKLVGASLQYGQIGHLVPTFLTGQGCPPTFDVEGAAFKLSWANAAAKAYHVKVWADVHYLYRPTQANVQTYMPGQPARPPINPPPSLGT